MGTPTAKSCATKPRFLWILPAKAALPPLDTTAKGGGSPVATSKCRRHFEAPTEPAGETAIPFGILSQQCALAPIGNPEPKEFAIPLESQMRFERSTVTLQNRLFAEALLCALFSLCWFGTHFHTIALFYWWNILHQVF